jgi:hypothetical protein
VNRKSYLFCLGVFLGIQLMTVQSQAYTNYGAQEEQESGDLPASTYNTQSPFDYPNFAEPDPTETEIQEQDAIEPIIEIQLHSTFQPTDH